MQSAALARWAAKKSDLYPNDDDLAQLIVDEAMESISEFSSKIPFDKDETAKKAKREEFLKSVLPLYMNLFCTRIKESGGPFICGKNITVADLFIYGQLHGIIYSGNFDYFPKDVLEKNFPLVHTLYKSVDAHAITRAELDAKI